MEQSDEALPPMLSAYMVLGVWVGDSVFFFFFFFFF